MSVPYRPQPAAALHTGMRLEVPLDASADTPSRARHAVNDWLLTSGCAPVVVDDVALVVSELVTNALMHTGAPWSCAVSLSDQTVRVEVTDAVAELPQPDTVAAIGGLGLRIVAELCGGWDWRPAEGGGGGKVVWAEVPTARPR